MRAILPALALAVLAGCSSHELVECRGDSPAYALNAPGIEPSVWDDGLSTFFRFPGNSRIPTFFVTNPDGKEAVASYTVDPGSHLVTVHQTAAAFKLRDGDAVMCITNNAYSPVGSDPGTGTTTPNVERVLRSAVQ